jgi:ribosomal protein S18 acetylase RimI-like enzyme
MTTVVEADREGAGARVRQAAAPDIDALILLYSGFMRHESVEPPAPEELRRRLARLLASPTDEVLLALGPAGEPVGYLQQRYFFSVWRPGLDAYVEDVFVVEELRGRRVGEQLMQAAFEAARARGAQRICLDANANNERGRHLYERLGFQTGNPAWAGAQQLFYSKLL